MVTQAMRDALKQGLLGLLSSPIGKEAALILYASESEKPMSISEIEAACLSSLGEKNYHGAELMATLSHYNDEGLATLFSPNDLENAHSEVTGIAEDGSNMISLEATAKLTQEGRELIDHLIKSPVSY